MSKEKQAYKLTLQQIDGNIRNLRYLTSVAIPGIYSIISHNYGLGRSQDVIDGMMEAIFDFICEDSGGVEITFVSVEAMEWWYGLKDEYFEQNNRQGDLASGNLCYKEEYVFNGPLFEE